MLIQRKTGTTSEILLIFIQDSASTTGAGKTGLAHNTAGLTAYYTRSNSTSATAISLVTMALGTYTSGGFREVDATNQPGWYQFCPPNGVFTSGRMTSIHLQGASGMAPCPIAIELTASDNQDGVRGGLTALPNANASSAGGLIVLGPNTISTDFRIWNGSSQGFSISGSNGTAQFTGELTLGGGIAMIKTDLSDVFFGGDELEDLIALPTATQNASAVWGALLSSYDSPDTFGAAVGYIYTQAAAFETMIQLDESVYQFTANALELGPSGGGGGSTTVNVAPFQITLTSPTFRVTVGGNEEVDLVLDQYTTPTISFGVYTADGTPVTLGSDTIRLVCYASDGTTFGELQTGGSGITVSGNTVTATFTETLTSTVRDARYVLRNITNPIVYTKARLSIELAPKDHA